MSIATATHRTASAELSNAHCDAILQHLKRSSERQTLVQIRDAIDAWTFETFVALSRLKALDLVDCSSRPFAACTYAATAKAVLS